MRKLGMSILFLLGLVIALLIGLRLAAAFREDGDTPPAEGRIVETALGPIYVEELGPQDGTAILLIHGSVGWSRMWQPTSQALADAGYRAIAFDMPPMGWSFRDPQGDYSRTTQASRVLALIDALKIRPILVAHSFGAGAGAEAVMQRPDAFAGLVVVSGAIGLHSHTKPATLPLPLRTHITRELAVSATVTNPPAMGPMLRKFLYRKDAATDDIVTMLNQPGRRAGTTAAIADWLPTLLVPPTDAQSTRPEAWQALTLPVAFLWGDRDTTTPLTQGERLSELTGGPLSILTEVGHIPQVEAPAEFQSALIATLSDLAD